MINERDKQKTPLFSDESYISEHTRLLRRQKKLPVDVQNYTVFAASSIAHSNMFLFNTNGHGWTYENFPIMSRWMPKNYEMTYSGVALDGFDLKVMLHLIKAMEDRSKPSPLLFDDYLEHLLSSDKAYQAMPNIRLKELYKKSLVQKNERMEGVFLKYSEFRDTVGICSGGKNIKMIVDSIVRMGNGVLTVTSRFTDGRSNKSIPAQLITPIYFEDSCYVTFPPIVYELFRHQTSQINTKIMRGIDPSKKKKSFIDPGIFSMICTYARSSDKDLQAHKVPMSDFLIKSPYYLLNEQLKGGWFQEGKIINTKAGSTLNNPLTDNQVKTAIRKTRANITKCFQNMEALGILKHTINGRGEKAEIVFVIDKKFEAIAAAKIRARKLDEFLLLEEIEEKGSI